jgi:transcriptional regulator NrdR family protein
LTSTDSGESEGVLVQKKELSGGKKIMMEVLKRDGTREVVKMEKILHAVTRACRGLDKVEPIEIAKRTISGLSMWQHSSQAAPVSLIGCTANAALGTVVAGRLRQRFVASLRY